MKLKKSILGVTASAALATVALASCGGDKTYTVELAPGAQNVEMGETLQVKAKNAAKLEEQLAALPAPTKEGYTFDGWFIDEDCNEKLTAETALKTIKNAEGKYVIYAGFTINTYTVSFDYSGTKTGDVAGAGIATASAKFRGKLASTPAPETPAKTANGEEYTFKGWYKDAARTQAFNKETDEIKGDTTLYAKWEIVEIKSVDDFIEYVSSSSDTNAVITADLTFTAEKFINRTKAYLETLDGACNATDNLINLNNKVYGRGHKLENMTIKGDLKSTALWAKVNNGAIYDVVFKNCTIDNTCAESTTNTAVICGVVDGKDAVIEDVVIDGLEINGGKSGVSALIGTVKNDVKVSVDGIVLKNVTMTSSGAKYSGGVIGLIDKTATGSVSVKDIIIDDLEIVGAAERAGLVFGGNGNGTGTIAISVEGAVISGSTSGKSSSAIGDSRNAKAEITLKDVVITKLVTNNTQNDAVDVFLTYSDSEAPAKLNFDNCKYRKWGITLACVDTTSKDPKVATPKRVVAGQEAAVNADLPLNLGGIKGTYNADTTVVTYALADLNATVDSPANPTEVDESSKKATFTSSTFNVMMDETSKDTSIELNPNTMVRLKSFAIPYVQKAVVGQAGYAVQITIAPSAEITTTEGRAILASDLYGTKINDDGTISGYIFLSDEELAKVTAIEGDYQTVIKTVTVQWYATADNVALPVVYKVLLQSRSGMTVGAKIQDGAITLAEDGNEANIGLTATTSTTDNTVLKLTAGNVVWDNDNEGNFVTVNIAKAAAYGNATAETIKVTEGTLVAYDGETGIATVKIKLNTARNFTITWDETKWDPITYSFEVAGATINKGTASFTPVTTDVKDITDINKTFDQGTKINDYITLMNAPDKAWEVDSNSKTIEGVSYTMRAKSGSKNAYIVVDLSEVEGDIKLKLDNASSSSSAARNATCTNKTNSSDEVQEFTIDGSASRDTLNLKGGNIYEIKWDGGGANFYGFILERA